MAGRQRDKIAPHKAGKSDEIKPKRAKDKLSYNKRGHEDFKEAALKSESWKGKQAVKRMQQSQGGQASGSNANQLGQPTPGALKARTGFNVGPRLAKGSYTGKFEKIKAGLIHNAKIKKQYAKMLKREGLDGGDSRMDTEEEDNNAEGDAPMEIEDPGSITSRRKGKGRMRNPDDMDQDGPSPTQPVLRKRKSSELERAPDDMSSDDEAGPAPGPDVPSSSTYVHPSRRDVDPEPQRKRQRTSEAEIEQKREKRNRDRLAWGKKTRKGQPNLGSRMGVLLGKVERNVAK